MNKSELLPQVRNLLDPILLGNGYRYLKGHEKYQKKTRDLRLWLYPNVTYWPSSNYCMVIPRVSVHVDAIENVLASHRPQKLDRHAPTLTILSENLAGGKFWSINTDQDLSRQAKDITQVVRTILLPLLDSWSDPKKVAVAAINGSGPSLFHSELHRLCVLFAYVAAFKDSEILPKIFESIDSDRISRSRNQMDPSFRQILASMSSDVPEIGRVGIHL